MPNEVPGETPASRARGLQFERQDSVDCSFRRKIQKLHQVEPVPSKAARRRKETDCKAGLQWRLQQCPAYFPEDILFH